MGVVPVSQGGKEEVLDWLKNSGRKVLQLVQKAKKELGNETLPLPVQLFLEAKKKVWESFGEIQLLNGLRYQ